MSPPELQSGLLRASSEQDLRDKLFELRATDGLPVILPTLERVEEMLVAATFAGYDSDLLLGEVGPNMGEATVEKVAINAVMAGCRPEHLPVVIAAVSALCDRRMDIGVIGVTTHAVTPLLIVNGPAVREAGIGCSFGALGYGQQANLCIGRAVRLCLINLGGTWPGHSAMAVLGQPASLAYCLGEDEAASPFPPLHTSLGFSAAQSVVTVTAQSAPVSVMVPPGVDEADMGERILDVLALAIANPANNVAGLGLGTVVVVLNPDHANALHQAGYDRKRIAAELAQRAVNASGLIRRLRGEPLGDNPDAPFAAISDPDAVLILVAGGPGVYSTVMTPWGGGEHLNPFVSREIIFSDSCEIG